MEKEYLIFISHSSGDNQLALEVYNLLLEARPEWKGQIFLDCCEELPLESTPEWEQAMMYAVENSRHLIFVTRNIDDLKKGGGWLRKEVAQFHGLQETRLKRGRPEKNVSYFGIFLCDCNMEADLYSDKDHGSLYRSTYTEQEHLILGAGASLQKEKGRIQQKAVALVEGRPYDDFACMLLERVKEFCAEQTQKGAMLADSLPEGETADQSLSYIDDRLLPPLIELPEGCEDESKLSAKEKKACQQQFDGLCRLVNQGHVQLIGKEGGCGKTTLMTKLFHHQLRLCEENLNDNMIPLYVDAKALAANDFLIIRYLAKQLLKDSTLINSEKTGDKANQLAGAFQEVRDRPRYLLLIDGFNELPKGKEETLAEELREFMPGGRYKNVRIVISGRSTDCDLPEDEFRRIAVQQLEKDVVYTYANKRVEKSALRILRTPMYLKMFKETGTSNGIHTRTDLLGHYLRRQEDKDNESAAAKEKKALYRILLRHVMPAVAYGMMTDNHDSDFILTSDRLDALLEEVLECFEDKIYRNYYGKTKKTFNSDLKESNIRDEVSSSLAEEFEAYFLGVCKLLHKDSDGKFEFVHQIYRDFFCAWHIAEAVRFDMKQGKCSDVLAKTIFSGDVIEFVKDLLEEKCVEANDGYLDYSCNDQSCLLQLLSQIRGAKPEGEAVAVANIVEMLRFARRKDLSGLDLSGLDLTESNLQGCLFSRFDINGNYVTNFSGARINRENLFTERHYDDLRAACTNDQYLVCLDEGGYLKFWEKKMYPRFPEKVLTDLRCAATKLLFHPDGSKIYAMTLHEILEIPVPEEFVSRAMPRRVFRTAHQLKDITLNDQGQLLFSTYLNPFNFKKITEPDAPDRIPVYDLNSAAAVNQVGTCLAYGFVAGHNELKIYDLQEDGAWKERFFGFGKLMQDFFLALEDLFRKFGVYDKFYADWLDTPERKLYFDRIRRDEMKQSGNLEATPAYVVKTCLEDLEAVGITLEDSQKEQLDTLVQEHQQRIKTALDEQGTLLHLNGRLMTGLSFHSDNKTLLISGTIDQRAHRAQEDSNPKTVGSNLVVTLNTETMEAKKINLHRGQNANRAFYCGDDIVVMTKYQVNVYDEKGNEVALVRPEIHRLQKMLHVPGQETFYILSNHTIYEMDRSLHCVRCIRNGLNAMNLWYVRDAQGEHYLRTNEKRSNPKSNAIDLRTGNNCLLTGKVKLLARPRNNLDLGSMHFEFRSNMLVAFCDKVERAETIVYQGLYVCGCDFRDVKGTVTEAEYIQSLHRMGAVTDPVTLPQVQLVADEDAFVPSREPLVLPKQYTSIPFVYRNDRNLKDNCSFKGETGNSVLSEKRTWELLHNNAASGTKLDAADTSTLEWVDALRLGTWDVINDLGAAGMIPPSAREHNLGGRMLKYMHSHSKLYFLTGHPKRDGSMAPVIASVYDPFGTTLLSYITGNKAEDPWYELQREKGDRTEPVEEFTEAEPEEKSEKNERFAKTICIDKPETLKKVQVILGLNRWFSITAKRHKDQVEDYALNRLFETNSHYDGRGKVNGYLRLGNQAFFGQAIHDFAKLNKEVDDAVISKVTRLSTMALYYRTLVSKGLQLIGLERQPIVVLIGESFEQCKQLNEHVQNICPHVRKIYTFDALLASDEVAKEENSYFEFAEGAACKVSLEMFIK